MLIVSVKLILATTHRLSFYPHFYIGKKLRP